MQEIAILLHDVERCGVDCGGITKGSAGRHIDLVSGVVSSVFKIGKAEMLATQRGKAPVAFARQVAMYLAHVALSHSLTEVGLAFKRDRTTVSHACQLVEDRREDPQIDAVLEFLERSIIAVAGLDCEEANG